MTAFPEAPIDRAFAPAKQGAQRHYGLHPYFTKRAWNVVQEYIKHFAPPGATVLDPFGGSGITAVEALVLKRKAVYCDINPWACFLARLTACAPVDLHALCAAFEEVEQRCRSHLETLWREPEEALAGRAVEDWYPQKVRLPSNADVDFVEELFTPRMLHGLARLRAAIMATEDGSARDLLLFAFSATLARINRTFLSAANRSETRGGSAIFSLYRYKVAKRAVELPLWPQFAQRFKKLAEAKRETNLLIGEFYKEGNTAVFRHGSATRLTEWIKPGTIDYIYTDPPYGGHIAYLDLSTMWTAWLDMEISTEDRREEIIEGGEQKKSGEDYSGLLKTALLQMHEVVKKGGWLSLVFAHRDTAYWESLVEACQSAGFTYCNTVVQPVGVVWSMHKKKNPLRVLSGELVLNFRKAAKAVKLARPAKNEGVDAAAVVRNRCEKEIVEKAGATTEELHHAVIPSLLEAGLLARFSKEHGDLVDLLKKLFVFDRSAGKWHLPETAALVIDVPQERLVSYYAARFLAAHAGRCVALPEIKAHLEKRLNGQMVRSDKRLTAMLDKVAESSDRVHWCLLSSGVSQGELRLKP